MYRIQSSRPRPVYYSLFAMPYPPCARVCTFFSQSLGCVVDVVSDRALTLAGSTCAAGEQAMSPSVSTARGSVRPPPTPTPTPSRALIGTRVLQPFFSNKCERSFLVLLPYSKRLVLLFPLKFAASFEGFPEPLFMIQSARPPNCEVCTVEKPWTCPEEGEGLEV